MGYPQKRPMTGFCPRGGDSGARDRCTGFWRTQVCDSQGKKPVVHTKTGLLLLRLCIYKKHKKKTEGQLQRPERGGLVEGEVLGDYPAACTPRSLLNEERQTESCACGGANPANPRQVTWRAPRTAAQARAGKKSRSQCCG